MVLIHPSATGAHLLLESRTWTVRYAPVLMGPSSSVPMEATSLAHPVKDADRGFLDGVSQSASTASVMLPGRFSASLTTGRPESASKSSVMSLYSFHVRHTLTEIPEPDA